MANEEFQTMTLTELLNSEQTVDEINATIVYLLQVANSFMQKAKAINLPIEEGDKGGEQSPT